MKLRRMLALVALLSATPLPGNAVEKKARPAPVPAAQAPAIAAAPEKMSHDEIKAALDNIEAMGKTVQRCHTRYQMQMLVADSFTNIRTLAAQRKAGGQLSNQARQQVEDEVKQELGIAGIVKECVEEDLAKGRETSDQFVIHFKADDTLQAKAKEALAQWTTAVSASGTPEFSAESGKFKTQANELKAELSLL